MITLLGLHKVYPAPKGADPAHALRGVDLTIARGRVQGIIGPSGSGKSTLGRCLTLLERPTSGSIRIDGQELTELSGAGLRAARRRIGVVFQSFNLLDARTAVGNVELPLHLAGVRAERRNRALEALERVGLVEKARSHPAQLSGGQQQRVAIARALVTAPDVLISDEATSALDPATTGSVVALIARLTDELGLTTVLITHQLDVVRDVCTDVATLEAGRITRRETLSPHGPAAIEVAA